MMEKSIVSMQETSEGIKGELILRQLRQSIYKKSMLFLYYVAATVRMQLRNTKKKLIRFPKRLSAELYSKAENLVKNSIDFSTNVILA